MKYPPEVIKDYISTPHLEYPFSRPTCIYTEFRYLLMLLALENTPITTHSFPFINSHHRKLTTLKKRGLSHGRFGEETEVVLVDDDQDSSLEGWIIGPADNLDVDTGSQTWSAYRPLDQHPELEKTTAQRSIERLQRYASNRGHDSENLVDFSVFFYPLLRAILDHQGIKVGPMFDSNIQAAAPRLAAHHDVVQYR